MEAVSKYDGFLCTCTMGMESDVGSLSWQDFETDEWSANWTSDTDFPVAQSPEETLGVCCSCCIDNDFIIFPELPEKDALDNAVPTL